MRALCNSAIEPGTSLFEVALIQFGTVSRPATRRVVKVLASTARGAKRIVRSRYPRSSSYEVIGRSDSLLDDH
jgi:hypothetical protein